jgi:plasmid stabilization system protein ParE
VTYHVVILSEAEEELDEAYRFIREDSPSRAARWRRMLLEKARSLASFPERCPVAPETVALGVEVRHLVVGSYHVLFVIGKGTVTVLHIRHAARRRATEEDAGG